MSLHAQLSPEADLRLRKQKRRSVLGSLIISILIIVLICVLMALLLLPGIDLSSPDIVSYRAQSTPDDTPEVPEVNTSVQRKPSAPSQSQARVIAANTSSSVAVPVPDVQSPTVSLDYGSGDGFGDGWGSGSGAGSSGGGGGFGSAEVTEGLAGYLYDFKQSADGTPDPDYNASIVSHFSEPVNRLQRSRFNESFLDNYYRSKDRLSVRYIAIPLSSAAEAPKLFGVEDEVEPKGWIGHYKARVTAPKSGTFRLAGAADDYISATVDNDFRLVAGRPDIVRTIDDRNANANDQPAHRGPYGDNITYGKWFSVEEGQKLEVTVTIGERPGGDVGFLLMLQEQGAEYRKTSSGRPILPPFTVAPFSLEDLDYLEDFSGWEWETKNVPIFQADS